MCNNNIITIRSILNRSLEAKFVNLCHFGSDINNKLIYFMNMILHYNKKYNLIGIYNEQQILNTCLLDNLKFNPYISITSNNVVELGAGNGILGITLSIIRPNIIFNLIESNRHKCYFLLKTVILLKLKNVFIIQDRAEKHQIINKSDTIICKHFALLSKFITISKNFNINNNKIITIKKKYLNIIKEKLPINYKVIKIQPFLTRLNQDIFYIIIVSSISNSDSY